MGQGRSAPDVYSWQMPLDRQIASKDLLREFCHYVRAQDSRSYPTDYKMTKKTAKKFLIDLSVMYDAIEPADLLAAIDVDERQQYEFDDFMALFKTATADVPLDLTESLQTYFEEAEKEKVLMAASSISSSPSSSSSSSKSKAFSSREYIDVPLSNVFVPRDTTRYTPPAQMFSREWSLVFACRILETKDLNNASLACKFFRTVLLRFPPPNFRVVDLSSLEKRTAEDMSGFANWSRMKFIVHLRIGAFNFANMLQDKDVSVILQNLQNLRHLTLLWSHLLTDQCLSRASNRGQTKFKLRALHLFCTRVSFEGIADAFSDHLEELRLDRVDVRSREDIEIHVPRLTKLRKLGIASVRRYQGEHLVNGADVDILSASAKCKLPLTHVWLTNMPYDSDASIERLLLPFRDTLQQVITQATMKVGMTSKFPKAAFLTEQTVKDRLQFRREHAFGASESSWLFMMKTWADITNN